RGQRLFQFDGTCFSEVQDAFGTDHSDAWRNTFGVNAYDIDNDGFEDVLIQGSFQDLSLQILRPNMVFRNTGTGGFVQVTPAGLQGLGGGWGTQTFADINRDGLIDVLYPVVNQNGYFISYFRNTSTPSGGSFTVDMRGPNGERNQQGRTIKVTRPN